jgi:hypothetical protein
MEVANGVSLEIPPVSFNLPLLFALHGGGGAILVVLSKSGRKESCAKDKLQTPKDKFQTVLPQQQSLRASSAVEAAAPLSKGIKTDFLTRFTMCIFVLPESW